MSENSTLTIVSDILSPSITLVVKFQPLAIILPNVDFPQPFSPIMVYILPRAIVKECGFWSVMPPIYLSVGLTARSKM